MFRLARSPFFKNFTKSFLTFQRPQFSTMSFLSNAAKDVNHMREPITIKHKGMEDIFSPFNQGIIYFNEGKFDEALKNFKKAKKEFDQEIPDDVFHFNMALCYQRMGNFLDAIENYEKSFEYASKSLETNASMIATILTEFVNLCIEVKKCDEAYKIVNQYLDTTKEKETINTAIGYGLLGRIHVKREEYDLARPQLQKSFELFEKMQDQVSNFFGMVCIDYGISLQHGGELDKAVEILKKGIDVLMNAKQKDFGEIKDGLLALSQVYHKQTKYQLALEACEKAKGLLKIKKFDLDLQE